MEQQHDELQINQEQLPANPENIESKGKYYIINATLVIYNIVLGYLFIKNSKDQLNSDCPYLGGYSFYYGVSLLLLGGFILLILCPCICRPCINKSYTNNMFGVIMSVEVTLQLVFLTALTMVYFYKESCGILNKFVLIYLIICHCVLLSGISIILWIIFHTQDINIVQDFDK